MTLKMEHLVKKFC